MKKQFACAMVVLVVLGGTLPVTRPASSKAISAYVPPTPVPSTLTSLSADSDEEGQPPSTLPDPVGLPPEEERTRVRLAAEAEVDEYGEEHGLYYQMVVTEVKVEGDWAYAMAQPQAASGRPLSLLAHCGKDGAWRVLMPSDNELYLRWLDIIPDSLVSTGEKSQLREQAVEANAVAQLPITTLPQQDALGEAVFGCAYLSPSGRFSLRFACGWEVERRRNNWNDADDDWVETTYFYASNGASIHIHAWRNSNNDTLLEWFEGQERSRIPLQPLEPILSTNAIIAGYPALVLVQPSVDLAPPQFRAYVTDGQFVLLVQYSAFDKGVLLPSFLDMIESLALPFADSVHSRDFQLPELEYPLEKYNGGRLCASSDCYAVYYQGCCGISDSSNPYPCAKHNISHAWMGNCTWWVAHVYPQLGRDVLGDKCSGMAHCWYEGARDAGYATGSSPRADAVYCNDYFGDGSGHVAVVTQVENAGQTARVSEMNWCWSCQQQSAYDASTAEGFVYMDGTCTAPSLIEPANDGPPLGSRTVTFRWDPPETCPGLDVYTFRVVDDPSKIDTSPWVKDHGIDDPGTWTVETFDQDDEYWWAVWPCRGCSTGNPNYGERSEVWHFSIDTSSPQQPPSVPTLKSPGDGSPFEEDANITLTWNGVADATDYVVEYWQDSGGRVSSLQGGTLWNIGTLYSCGTYSWHVRAHNDVGYSDWSDTWTFTLRLAPPSNLSAQAVSCNQIDLSWSDNSSLNTGYRIYRNGSPVGEVGSRFWNISSYQDIGLSENTGYSYYVKAFRGTCESEASNTVNVSTPSCCDPNGDQVALYADTDYGGSCVTLDIGDYPNPGYLGDLGNDNAESIKVGANVQAVLCENDDYKGRCETFTDNDPNLWDNTIGGEVVSSVRVQPHTSDWRVEYYSDNHLGSRCYDGYQGGTYVFGDWDNDAPVGGCPSDYFSARFSRSVDFPGGEYTFALGYDDGARIKVDGQTVVDGWAPSAQHYETRNISSGQHYVEIEYFENAGGAYLTAFWWGPGFDVPRQSRDDNQWYAQYWGNRALWWGSVVRVNEGQGFLNHQWDQGGPGYNLPADRFGARFERTVHFAGGRWRFDISSDDGVRLRIDGNLILDEWNDQVASFSPEVDLAEGDHQLRLEYYENSGGANIQMSWVQLDITPPSGRITSPPDGAVIGACPLTIRAEASDGESGVDFVEFHANYDDGSGYGWHHLGNDDTSPYIWNWDCSSLDDQDLSLTIHIRDHAGNEVVEPGGHVDIDLNRQPGVELVRNSSHIVRPGQEFDPFVTVRVTSGQLDPTRGDHLHALPEGTSNTLGAWPVQPVNYAVDVGQTYVFNTSNDISFRMTAPDADGDYESIWRVRAGGDHIGPTIAIPVTVDDTPPSGRVLTPADDAILNADTVHIEAEASDDVGIDQVQFFAWYSNEWHYIDRDTDGADGYQVTWDVSGLSDRSGIWLDALILDRVWNRWDAKVGNLMLDRTPPNTSAGVSQMYGDAPFRDFYVYWWDSHDNLSGIASYDVQYRDGASGTWTDLLTNTDDTYTRFVGFDGHTYYFRTRARDSAGNQSAYASGNGDVQHKVEICYTPPDAYEVDDTRANARWIIPDAPMQVRSFYAQGDRDWVRFYAAAGITYTLMTTNIGGHSDTVLYLYGSDRATLITSNADTPGRWPASRIDWQPSKGGFYWAKVEHWDPWAYGCTTGYGLSITGSRPTPFSQVYLPLVVRNLGPSYPSPTAVETLNFRVGFYGRDNTADEPQNVPIKVTIKNLALDRVLLESGWVSVTPASGSDNWGTASVDVSSAGLVSGQYYQVFVRGAMHLAKRIAVPLSDGLTLDYTDMDMNPDGVLWTCDVDQNNQVNREDVMIVASHYGQTASTSPAPSSELYRSDQDGDGMVGGPDLSICASNCGRTGDPY